MILPPDDSFESSCADNHHQVLRIPSFQAQFIQVCPYPLLLRGLPTTHTSMRRRGIAALPLFPPHEPFTLLPILHRWALSATYRLASSLSMSSYQVSQTPIQETNSWCLINRVTDTVYFNLEEWVAGFISSHRSFCLIRKSTHLYWHKLPVQDSYGTATRTAVAMTPYNSAPFGKCL